MSDTTYSDYSDADREETVAPTRLRPRTRLRAAAPVEPEYDEYNSEDEYDDEVVEERVGLFSTPARTITIVGGMLMLLFVGVAIAWQLGANSNPTYSSAGLGVPQSVGPKAGLMAPSFSLIDVQTKKPVSLESLRGKPVLINFWGTWCPPCKAEMPEMEKLYQQYKDQVHMVGISMGPRDEMAGVEQFVQLNGYHWEFIHDADSSVMNNYQVTGIPSSFFIDKNGVVRSVHIGQASGPELEANLKIALNAQ